MSESTDMSVYLDQIKTLLREHPVEMVTAVQVSNPHARGRDPAPTWKPEIVVIDYLK